jgi:hypothetical protein
MRHGWIFRGGGSVILLVLGVICIPFAAIAAKPSLLAGIVPALLVYVWFDLKERSKVERQPRREYPEGTPWGDRHPVLQFAPALGLLLVFFALLALAESI